MILVVGYCILLSSKILAGHFSKITNSNGFYAFTEKISCSRTPIAGATSLHANNNGAQALAISNGLKLYPTDKQFLGWIGRQDGKITTSLYENETMYYIVICQ